MLNSLVHLRSHGLNASALYNPNSHTISITSNLIPNTLIHTLIDSSSTHCFLDTSITYKHQLHTYNINLIPLQLFNSTTNSVVCLAIDLLVCFPSGDEHSVTFYVTPLDSSCTAVLGHNWFTHFNLLIDWVLGSITFCSLSWTDSLMSLETVAPAPISSKTPPPLTPLVALKVSFINATAFAHLSKMDDTQVYQLFLSNKSAPDDTPVNMMGIPSDYHDFTDIFSKTRACTLAPHWPYDLKIELEEGTSPPFRLIYSLSQSELKPLWESLDKHLVMDFIWPSQSLGGAPVLFAHKKDGLLWLCIDFHGLNKIMKKDHYPLPCITSLLDSLCKAKIYSKIDLPHAYHLVQIQEGDKWKTAFWTCYSSFEWRVMPFRLTNAPTAFQCFMNDVFGNCKGNPH